MTEEQRQWAVSRIRAGQACLPVDWYVSLLVTDEYPPFVLT